MEVQNNNVIANWEIPLKQVALSFANERLCLHLPCGAIVSLEFCVINGSLLMAILTDFIIVSPSVTAPCDLVRAIIKENTRNASTTIDNLALDANERGGNNL